MDQDFDANDRIKYSQDCSVFSSVNSKVFLNNLSVHPAVELKEKCDSSTQTCKEP